MNLTIRFFAQFREKLGAVHELTVPEGARLVEILHEIAGQGPDGEEALFGSDGQLRDYVIVMQGPQRVERDRVANLELRDRDTIAVFPPVAGG